VVIWYIFSGFGIMDHEKSGSPGRRKRFGSQKVKETKTSANKSLLQLCTQTVGKQSTLLALFTFNQKLFF
jgi:hypothetical protein